jgi:hypothetical protein
MSLARQVDYKGERKSFAAEEISSMVLVKMRETAEAYLDEDVTSAVIAVPAHFTDSQRQARVCQRVVPSTRRMRVEPTVNYILAFYKRVFSSVSF